MKKYTHVGTAIAVSALVAISGLAQAGQYGNARMSVVGPSSSLNNNFGDYHSLRVSGANNFYKRNRFYKVGVRQFEANEYDKAYSAFHKVLALRPQDPNVNFYMARINAKKNKHRSAIKNYKLSLRRYTDDPILMAGLGISYAKSSQRVKAKEVLAKLEAASLICSNICADAPKIATSLHVVAISLYPSQQ